MPIQIPAQNLQVSIRQLMMKKETQTQIHVNKGMVSEEDDDQCFGVAQSEPRPTSNQKPIE